MYAAHRFGIDQINVLSEPEVSPVILPEVQAPLPV